MTRSNQMDKRKHPRLDKTVVLRVAPQGGHAASVSEWTLVTSKNISAGGVLFTYDRSLNEGAALDISIHFPKKTIQCSGVVHRTSPAAHQPLVNVAAKLESLANGDLEFMKQYRV